MLTVEELEKTDYVERYAKCSNSLRWKAHSLRAVVNVFEPANLAFIVYKNNYELFLAASNTLDDQSVLHEGAHRL